MPLNSGNIEQDWADFKNTVHSTCSTLLGPKTHSPQDWFDENNEAIDKLLEEKNMLLKLNLSNKTQANAAALHQAKQKVQIELRHMKDKWLKQKADEIQDYADSHNSKRFYQAVRTLYGPQPADTSPLLSEDGTKLITDKSGILDRWAEHFESVLNMPSTISDEAINRLPQAPIDNTLDNPPSATETEKAIKQMSTGKAPGADTISAEIYKAAGKLTIQKMTELFQSMWKRKRYHRI